MEERRNRNTHADKTTGEEAVEDVEMWHNRKHDEVNYYITQMLSHHSNFRKCNMGKTKNPACIYVDEPLDDENHTFLSAIDGKKYGEH